MEEKQLENICSKCDYHTFFTCALHTPTGIDPKSPLKLIIPIGLLHSSTLILMDGADGLRRMVIGYLSLFSLVSTRAGLCSCHSKPQDAKKRKIDTKDNTNAIIESA